MERGYDCYRIGIYYVKTGKKSVSSLKVPTQWPSVLLIKADGRKCKELNSEDCKENDRKCIVLNIH